jgi:hypothetical protein
MPNARGAARQHYRRFARRSVFQELQKERPCANKQVHSANPLEQLNAEIKRLTDVVGIFPNEAAITRLVRALLLEQDDEWSLQRRCMQLKGLQTLADQQPAWLSAVVSWVRVQLNRDSQFVHHAAGRRPPSR